MSKKMVTVNDKNFAAEVEKSTLPVLVDFGATWCGPCKALGGTLDAMMDGYRDKVKFCYADIQESPMTAQKLGIRSVPTVVVFRKGAPAGSLLGAQPRPRLEELIGSVLRPR